LCANDFLGAAAIREIKHYQKQTGVLIPAAPFTRLVRDISIDMGRDGDTPFRWQSSAIKALQESAEAYLTAFFESMC
jgi:histone H3/H4